MKKFMGAFLVAMLLFSQQAMVTDAAQLTKTNGSKGFTSAWQLNATADSGKATMTYGFNKNYINEDYAWANHTTKSHYASLKNGKGWYTGPTKSARVQSKKEVVHSGTSITYVNNY